MNTAKETEFAFVEERKAKLVERIRALAERHKSLRAAARVWEMSFSTLNNYINRGTEPSFFVIHNISMKENVSMDWLAYGSHDPFEFNKVIIDLQQTQIIPGRDTWLMIFDNLDPEERKSLLNYCIKVGAPNLASLTRKIGPNDQEFIALPEEEKERVLRLYRQVKKGSSDDSGSVAEADLSSKNQKAG